ncbi:MAG: hypothetical protein DRH10_00700 [Deltaproteobacteria bacterium]|nr:MAG: hypothetical protein DRH10_00700 [Deltaproteobacteria bacterium]RLC88362.1 MAG: hypothetical protein DRJ03_02915 [Chloroflexota bacterium]
MGQFVDKLTPHSVFVGSPWSKISERIDEVQAYAEDWTRTLEQAILDLTQGIEAYTPNLPNIRPNIPGMPNREFPIRPDLITDFNDDWPDTNLPDPSLRDVTPDTTLEPHTPPDPVDPGFSYTPGAYQSCLLETLCEKIKDSLLNGGTGLSDLVYALIVDRNREARRAVEERSRQRAMDAVGAKGLKLPGGMAAAVILEHENEILAKGLDAVSSTTIKDFELADENTRFSKELALKLEEVQSKTYQTNEDRLFNIAKTAKEMILASFEQNVKLFLAEKEGDKTKLEAAKIQIETATSYNDGQMKIFLGRGELINSRISAIASENQAKTDQNKGTVAIYETETKAVATEVASLLEEIKVALARYKTEVDVAISTEELNLKAFTSAAELGAQISTSIANIAAQSVASALGAVNTSMSFGYSGSNSSNATQSISNALGESHPYSEE